MPDTDNLQAMYDHKYADEVPRPMRLSPHALSTSRYDDVARLAADEDGAVLDLGCGGGQLLMALSSQFESLSGLDLSDNRIRAARQAVVEHCPEQAERFDFRVGRADETLPYANDSFDVVIACAVIEHVVNLFVAMDEIARVCRPGGCVIITVPNICYVKHVFSLIAGQVPLTGTGTYDISYWREHGWDGGHFHYFSKRALGDLLLHCGFAPEAWTGDGRYARIRRWYQNFVGCLTVKARRTSS